MKTQFKIHFLQGWIVLILLGIIVSTASFAQGSRKKVSIELLPDTDHGGPGFNTAENINKVFVFLDKYLK